MKTLTGVLLAGALFAQQQPQQQSVPVTPPKLLSKVEPRYTEEAKKNRIEGTVEIYALVDKNGVPTSLRILKSLDPGLDEAAMEAVRQWRFRPATKSGQPIDWETRISTAFNVIKGSSDGSVDAWDTPDAWSSPSSRMPPPATMTAPQPIPIMPSNATPKEPEPSALRWESNCPTCSHQWDSGVLQKGMTIAGVTTWLSVSEQANRFIVSVAVRNDSKHSIDVKPDGFSLRVVNPSGIWVGALPIDKKKQEQYRRILLANTVNPGGRIDGAVYFPKQTKRYQDLVITFRVGWLTFEFPWSAVDR
jgi:TonB family protein